MKLRLRQVDGDYGKVWGALQLVRSGHDLWTLQIELLYETGNRSFTKPEHIMVSPSTIDILKELGVQVRDETKKPSEVKKK